MKRTKDRFSVTYSIKGSAEDAREKARDICVEQTVEFPLALITDKYILGEVPGRIEAFTSVTKSLHQARISYPVLAAGSEVTQFLNVLFGNTSLKPGIRVERIEPSHALFRMYAGPRFGIDGIREAAGVRERPLLATAIKPMGLDAGRLADLAYGLASAGIDVIKDDHGLADQEYASFAQRARLCSRAVAKANAKTGGRTIYAPNVTADGDEVVRRAREAKRFGAGALVVSPGLAGFHSIRAIREDRSICLPVFFHPALLGSFVSSRQSGISHYAIFGQIPRIFGADASIFPNFGGRFSFSRSDCARITEGARGSMGTMKPVFPMPGGGINLSSIRRLVRFYGNDVILLVGGGLFEYDADVAKGVAYFKSLIS